MSGPDTLPPHVPGHPQHRTTMTQATDTARTLTDAAAAFGSALTFEAFDVEEGAQYIGTRPGYAFGIVADITPDGSRFTVVELDHPFFYDREDLPTFTALSEAVSAMQGLTETAWV